MNIIEKIDQETMTQMHANKRMDDFSAGDSVRVNVKIIEGSNERIQAFEGIVIARKNAGVNSSFTVRKLSHGEGVERIFPLYSPRIDSVERVRKGVVRRAKLYYLRGLTGKAARIKEKLDFGKKSESAPKKAKKEAKNTAAEA
jgi:large subunit ribosomal protein L19